MNSCNECEWTESTVNLVRPWHVLTSKALTICEQQFRTWLQAITTLCVFQRMVFLWCFQASQKSPRRMSGMSTQFLFPSLTSFAAHLRLMQAESSGGSGAQFGCLCTVWLASKLVSGENDIDTPRRYNLTQILGGCEMHIVCL